MTFTFWGTDEFSVSVLETLKKQGLIPSLVVTVPDKPKGRKMIITPSPVKIWATKNQLTLIQPANLKDEKIVNFFNSPSSPHSNFWLVASYGKIIPRSLLDIPPKGVLNIHPSLLPKYRGPSPIETTILNGDTRVGVTIMKLDEEMDHGPIIAQRSIEITADDNFEKLRETLAVLGAELLAEILPTYLTDQLIPQAQNHEQATYTKKLTKEDGFLDQQNLPLVNYQKFLALNPWPGTYLDYPGPKGKIRVIVKQAHLENNQLIYDRVIPAGKTEMTWSDFLRGLKNR